MTTGKGSTAEDAAPLGLVVGQVKAWIERCGWIWAEAQVIEVRRRNAPTQFLRLRDASSNVSALVTCTATVLDAAGPLVDGSMVVARLTPRVYAERAELSFECSEIRLAGEGRLLAQLEALKRKLAAEGLFDPVRKKSLPFLPRCIGLITGAGAAAEGDVLTNARLRWPAVRFAVRHVLVQGASSAAEVMVALADLDDDPDVDVIVIARGGGSLEALLPFSDEGLVRAVAAARTPVVSAIGHEQDMPLIDLAADVRASTPTDAAKRVVPDVAAEGATLREARSRLRRTLIGRLQVEQAWLDQMRSRPAVRDAVASLGPHAEQVGLARLRLREAMSRRLATEQAGLDHAVSQCRALSPGSTLRRGYAIATVDDAPLTSVRQVAIGTRVCLTVTDGALATRVERLEVPAEAVEERSQHGDET
ncbi:MAG: exodeoxyribonuclease VII large subunit [Micrococcales bacterium]|nr:exodeoxyribonuclease VII large subunit [Micrococcales bacterium]